ncbi:MAG: lipid-A-disaccharide synthase [Bacteroidota bacterium]
MNFYLIAGEASGDLHGANLMKALRLEDAEAHFRCWGGDLMQAAGGQLVKHYRTLAFMGFWEVARNIRTISKNLDFCKKDLAAHRPDVLILIDYSGFNLRIAKWAKLVGIRVFYYIAPQVWASRQGRVAKIKAYVDRLFVILPFEKAFYQQHGMDVDFVGHPLLDAVAAFREKHSLDNPSPNPLQRGKGSSVMGSVEANLDIEFPKNEFVISMIAKPIIALLPGSRRQEISSVLIIMLSLVEQFSEYQFVIGVAPSISLDFYEKIITESGLKKSEVILLKNQTYALLNRAKAAIVTSGTATLETALFEVPQVVCYKGSWLTYQIAKRIIQVPYISLVNLIANRSLVKELIQNELTTTNLKKELMEVLQPQKVVALKNAYRQIKAELGEVGASERTAKLMLKYLKATYHPSK